MTGAAAEEFFSWLTLMSMAATIGFARYYGLTFVFPLFSWMEVRGPLRFAIAAALSVPSMLMVYQMLRVSGPLTPFLWAALVAKEAFIGALIGGLLGLPFWAIQGIGDTVDVYRGASAANLFDPVHAQEMTISGKFFVMFALALFAVLGGIGESVDLVQRSHGVWPALSLVPPFEISTLKGVADVGLKAITIALVLGAPLLIALLLVDVALIFAVRGARSFNIYDLTNAARGLLLIIILPVYATFFAHHFQVHLRGLLQAFGAAITAVGH